MADDITLDAPETRLERFLAAAAGMDGITLDEPKTRIEKYLYKIAQGSGGVPPVEDADKGKYLHANESTGDLEWATAGGGGSGGGVLVVNLTASETGYTCDKTAAEIMDGVNNGAVIFKDVGEGYTDISYVIGASYSEADGYTFGVLVNGNSRQFYYTAASGTDYPSITF